MTGAQAGRVRHHPGGPVYRRSADAVTSRGHSDAVLGADRMLRRGDESSSSGGDGEVTKVKAGVLPIANAAPLYIAGDQGYDTDSARSAPATLAVGDGRTRRLGGPRSSVHRL